MGKQEKIRKEARKVKFVEKTNEKEKEVELSEMEVCVDRDGKIDGVERQDCMPVNLTEVNFPVLIDRLTKIEESFFPKAAMKLDLVNWLKERMKNPEARCTANGRNTIIVGKRLNKQNKVFFPVSK